MHSSIEPKICHIGKIFRIVLDTFLEIVYYKVQQNVYIFCEVVLMMCTVS